MGDVLGINMYVKEFVYDSKNKIVGLKASRDLLDDPSYYSIDFAAFLLTRGYVFYKVDDDDICIIKNL